METRGPAPGQSWDEWLAEGMRYQRQAMLAHRDGARLAAGNRPVRDSWPIIEGTLRVLVDAGFDPKDAVRAIIVMGQYVSGFVLDEQHDAERHDDTPPDIDPEEFPLVFAGVPAALDRDTLFEYGLQCLLDGMRARTGSGSGHQPGTGTRPQP
jgi:TetR/AcrR family tetracycline transcriptional repressor